MTPRPALGTATAALCALLALTACQGSPEAGHPNTTPVTPTPTPTPTAAPSTPTWTPAEAAAIAAAKARYLTARAAVGKALQSPEGVRSPVLEAAGNGGAWLQSILERLDFFTQNGLYQTGTSKILSTAPKSVDLGVEQPTVVLMTCIDGTGVQMRYRATGKPVPVASTVGGGKHGVTARFAYAANTSGKKMWFLVDEKAAGAC